MTPPTPIQHQEQALFSIQNSPNNNNNDLEVLRLRKVSPNECFIFIDNNTIKTVEKPNISNKYCLLLHKFNVNVHYNYIVIRLATGITGVLNIYTNEKTAHFVKVIFYIERP